MKLELLLERMEYELITGDTDREISSICSDSRKVEKDSLFFCIKGFNVDGHKYIEKAVNQGASALLVQDNITDENILNSGITIIKVEDTRQGMAEISSAFYGRPSEKMKVIGITGTKGKTTTAMMVKDILERAGIKCGLMGTVNIDTGKEVISAVHTTPESIDLQRYLYEMYNNGCKAVVMEASSQGFKLKRTYGINFHIGLFTNIEPDHIGENEHPDFADYLNCKKILFKQSRVGIYNKDADHIDEFLKGQTCPLKSYSLKDSKADYFAANISLINEDGVLGSTFTVGEEHYHLHIPGRFNIYNALSAIAVAKEMGISQEVINQSLMNIRVPGRCECIDVSKDYVVMIDYAHNAMALESLLTTLSEYHIGRLICLFGCGGNRSRQRRFEMGEVAGKCADLTIITSDNPRFEKPLDIIKDIETGINKTDGKYIMIEDRRKAIAYVLDNAKKGDVIILAGKGHESYQEIEGVKYDMDERDIIREYLDAHRSNC